MADPMSPFKHIVVVAHPKVQEAGLEAERVTAFLQGQHILATCGLLYDEALLRRVQSGEFDLLIALGGDGTMLRAGRLCGPLGIPVLGINMGRFGFLMEVGRDQWVGVMSRLLSGDYWLERRMMLAAAHWRNGELQQSWDVLNDVVVSRGQIVRPIHLEAYLDGYFLTTYVADALIASTPTGSTAYAMAAGGPILPPEVRNILLIAVSPHISLDRAIVLAEGSSISITVHTDHQAVLSIDGQSPEILSEGDRVEAHAGEYSVQFVRFQDPGYFYRNLTSCMNKNPVTGSQR